MRLRRSLHTGIRRERDEMMDKEALTRAVRAAFYAGREQGFHEKTALQSGYCPTQSADEALTDFMAEWNESSAPIRALLTEAPK